MDQTNSKISFHPEENYALARIKGTLLLEEIESVFQRIVTSEEYNSNMGRIWDLTEADLSELDDKKIKQASQITTTYAKDVKKTKVALVSKRDINLPILQLFRMFTGMDKSEVEVFKSLNEAITWQSE